MDSDLLPLWGSPSENDIGDIISAIGLDSVARAPTLLEDAIPSHDTLDVHFIQERLEGSLRLDAESAISALASEDDATAIHAPDNDVAAEPSSFLEGSDQAWKVGMLAEAPKRPRNLGSWLSKQRETGGLTLVSSMEPLSSLPIRKLDVPMSASVAISYFQPRTFLDLPIEAVYLSLQFLDTASASLFMRTCRAAYELGMPSLLADVRIWRDDCQLSLFCLFMLAQTPYGTTKRAPHLRALTIVGARPYLPSISTNPDPRALLIRVLREAANLEAVSIQLLEAVLTREPPSMQASFMFGPNVARIRLDISGPLSSRVVRLLKRVRIATLSHSDSRSLLELLEGSQETLVYLCACHYTRGALLPSVITLRPLRLKWPNLRVLQTEDMHLRHLPRAMPNLRKLLIHDRWVFGQIEKADPQGDSWPSLDYLYTGIVGIVNHFSYFFPCRCRTLELDLGLPFLTDTQTHEDRLRTIRNFILRASPVHLGLKLDTKSEVQSNVLIHLRDLAPDLEYLKLQFVTMDLSQPPRCVEEYAPAEAILRTMQRDDWPAILDPVVWSSPRPSRHGPILDISEQLAVLARVLGVAPKTISCIELSPYYLPSGGEASRSAWRVAAQSNAGGHGFEVRMLSEEETESGYRKAGFTNAANWRQGFLNMDIELSS